MTLEQSPRALHRVRDTEEPTDQLLDSRQGPPLISPAVCQRSTLQLPFQPGDLGTAEPRPTRRPLRGDTSRPTLTPLPPPFHRSSRHPQSGSDGPVRVFGFEPSHRIQPHSLPGFPLGVGQAAALRVPHGHSSTAQRAQRSAERPDITQSSSVALFSPAPYLKLAKPLHAEASHPRSDREVESPFPKAAPPSGEVKVPSLGSHTAIIPLRCALTGDARRCEAAKLAYFVSFGWLVCTCSRKTVRSWT